MLQDSDTIPYPLGALPDHLQAHSSSSSHKRFSAAFKTYFRAAEVAVANGWQSIEETGVEHISNAESKRKLILCNQISMFGALAQLPFLIVHLVDWTFIGVVFNLMCISFSIFVWRFNQRGHFFYGKLFMVFSYNLSVFLTACLYGTEFPDIAFFYFCIIMEFWLAEDTPQDRRLLKGSVALSILLFALIKVQIPLLDASQFTHLSPLSVRICHALTPATSMYFILMGSFIFWRDKATAEQKLHHEIQRSESLLVNILPVPVAEQLKQGERSIAKYYEHVTVLFADLVGFTRIATAVSPQQLLSMLDTIFSRFDVIVQKHGVEKIKTIGDAYMLVGGIPEQQPNHAEAVARVALEMQECLSSLPPSFPIGLSVRIGIHTGEVIAGVIGHTKFSYDLWGDTVNTASRMESHGEPGKIHCSDAIYHLLKDQFHFEPCGLTEIKGKGMMQTWFLVEEQRP